MDRSSILRASTTRYRRFVLFSQFKPPFLHLLDIPHSWRNCRFLSYFRMLSRQINHFLTTRVNLGNDARRGVSCAFEGERALCGQLENPATQERPRLPRREAGPRMSRRVTACGCARRGVRAGKGRSQWRHSNHTKNFERGFERGATAPWPWRPPRRGCTRRSGGSRPWPP